MGDLSNSADVLASALRLLVALAVGLLIGLDREWRMRREGDQRHIGLRTLGLIGLLGGIAGLLQPMVGGWLVAAALLGLSFLLLADRARGDPGSLAEDITTLIAAMVALLLGALATAGLPQLAAATAVVVVALLNLKPTLHRWVEALSETELRAVVRLLVISLVILPVLPNEGYGPYQALNPRIIWWFVVLISTLSFVGYVAIKVLGPSRGYLVIGFFGGLVSSTATTAALARLSHQDHVQTRAMAAGVAVANAVMAIRMTVIAAAISPALGIYAAWPLGCAAAAAVLFALLLWRGAAVRNTESQTGPIEMENPFGLGPALKLAGLLAVVLVLAKFLEDRYGQSGVQVLAIVAGLVDVDAITLTVSRETAQGAAIAPAVVALLLAALSNGVFKGALLASAGGKLALLGIAALVVMTVAGGLAWLVPPPWS